MDIVGLLSFGFDLRSQRHEKHRFLADGMAEGNWRLNIYMQVPMIPRYRLQTVLNLLLPLLVVLELIIFVGGDTTATAIAVTLFYIARHRGCYDRLAKEIRTTFKKGSEIKGNMLSSCNYLRACVDEALRMSPPIPGTLWRQASPGNGEGSSFIVDGHIIPKGTYVGVNTYALHHNEVGALTRFIT